MDDTSKRAHLTQRTWFQRLLDGLFGRQSPAKKEFEKVKHEATQCLHKDDANEPSERRQQVGLHKAIAVAVCCVIALMSTGCSVQQEYVEADLATYEAVAPDYLKLLEASDRTDAQKELARLLIESWKLRIDKALEESGDSEAP